MSEKIKISFDNPGNSSGSRKLTCPVCTTHIEADDSTTVCPACKVIFHEECWQDNKGCSTYGCKLVNIMNPPVRVDIPQGTHSGGMNREQMLQQLKGRLDRGEIDQATSQRIYQEIMSAPMPAPSSPFNQPPPFVQPSHVQPPHYSQPVSSHYVQSMPTADTAKMLNTYFTVFWICMVIGIPIYALGSFIAISDEEVGGIVICLAGLGIIPGLIFCYMLLYRLWKVVPSNIARTTHGKAAGFCFIPFFNFYWQFVAWKGLAEDMNTSLQSRGISLKVNKEQAMNSCISWIALYITDVIIQFGAAGIFYFINYVAVFAILYNTIFFSNPLKMVRLPC